MQRTATNITWNASRITWLGGLAFILILLGTAAGGCAARDAAASVRTSPDVKAQGERGAYLVTVAGCNDCHTP
jgi:hypothetical protein